MHRVDLDRAEALHLDARDAAYGWEGHALSREEARAICEALSTTPALLARLRALEEVARAAEDMLRGRECDQRHGRWSECDGALDAALRAALAAAKEGA